MPALHELTAAYQEARADQEFQKQLNYYLKHYAGRPTPLYLAERLTKHIGTGKIYLKREDLCHTGSHKINNTLGQVLLALRMGKRRIIAETGAGQHGVATATSAAMFGLECEVFMGEEDMRRQQLNVFRMQMLGARVLPVSTGSRTLKDATNDAFRDWMATFPYTYYVIGSVVGPHPYPMMVRNFQCVIGREARAQILEKEGRLPDYLVACVGGGSNSVGLFYPFLGDSAVKMIGVEAGGVGSAPGQHGATLVLGRPGVLHGAMSYVLQDDDGQTVPTRSVAAGLDYPGVGPEHSMFKEEARVEYACVSDQEAIEAFRLCSQAEGMIPALESSHAVAYLMKNAERFSPHDLIILCMSGRGDKDADILAELDGQ